MKKCKDMLNNPEVIPNRTVKIARMRDRGMRAKEIQG